MAIETEIEIGLDFAASFDVDTTDHIEGASYALLLRGPSSTELTGTYASGKVAFIARANETNDWKMDRLKKLTEGSLTAKPNFSAIEASTDMRSSTEIVLGHINAILEGRATWESKRFKIGTRELERHEIGELLALKKQLEAQIEREATGRKSVRPFGRRVHVGFR